MINAQQKASGEKENRSHKRGRWLYGRAKSSPKIPRNPYIKEETVDQMKGKHIVKNQRSNFTLETQANSISIECPRDEHHTLTCDPKTTCLKNQRSVSMMENTFNLLVSHYFCDCHIVFPLLPMIGFDNQMSGATLKDFSAVKAHGKPFGRSKAQHGRDINI